MASYGQNLSNPYLNQKIVFDLRNAPTQVKISTIKPPVDLEAKF